VSDVPSEASSLLLLTPGDREPPLFLVHGLGGDLGDFDKLRNRFRSRHALWGIAARGLDGTVAAETSVEAMAAHYLKLVRARQPQGPYLLGGYSFGGLVALETARRLAADGAVIGRLILIHTMLDERHWPTAAWLRVMVRRLRIHGGLLRKSSLGEIAAYLRPRLRKRLDRVRRALGFAAAAGAIAASPSEKVRAGCVLAMACYAPVTAYGGKIVFLSPADDRGLWCDPHEMWRRFAPDLEIHTVAGDHLSMMRDDACVASVADALSRCLDTFDRDATIG
jgi:acetoacetyl-CoA synthetase